MTTKNACAVWDTNFSSENLSVDEIKKWCNEYAKHWAFQEEQGKTTGYRHWQIRVSLKVRTTNMIGKLYPTAHWSATSKTCASNFDYVLKADTRIDGPWTDKDIVRYVPKHIRGKTCRKWQQEILDTAGCVERDINVVVDFDGCIGKTWLAAKARSLGYITIPPIGDAERLIATTCDVLKGKKLREPNLIIFDIPRAVDKRRLNHLFITIETIKGGWVYDTRNNYKEWEYDPPAIWVFTNHEIPTHYMSKDTWNFWEVANEQLCSVADNHPIINNPSGYFFEEAKFDWECQQMIGDYILDN